MEIDRNRCWRTVTVRVVSPEDDGYFIGRDVTRKDIAVRNG